MAKGKRIYDLFVSLKGEFEAEGLTRDEVAGEALFAARRGLDYLVKIGGCEAKSDLVFLQQVGISSVVAPMIESPFAMSKYMAMVDPKLFDHIGVTIETATAVSDIDRIIDAGVHLTDVTIGRSDLTASFGGSGVDSAETIRMVKTVAAAAKERGLHVTMGGSVSAGTRDLLRKDAELRSLLDHIETRKAIMTVDRFIADGTLEAAIEAELDLLVHRGAVIDKRGGEASSRADKIRERL
ncbi:hypothetical protein HMF7854_05620 [Sphingomonas ginkgonis]|uniref:HpcH/HpaI aldolase/citrate lyase domain-containing protein n=1 Tax=Sphingomonas ginkgonis TaxID=2315330 RepID=A0A429V8V2_9SPHN|nr:aldolase/citrate lyase family protein [Sphingomonas ginkgonis]RST30358.1 hypothetical protein HMF7854_05620 [Sphingomonas ginkgonis]